ncbi:MAG: UpxY family transcription antiterminator [Vicinamibacterales bacterium]
MTTGPDRRRWFAVWTRSRHEQAVRDQLRAQEVDVFLPTITKWSRWKDRRKKIDWPLFPGYCFVRIEPTDTMRVLKCRGVVRIVSFEGGPAPIPETEIESIRQLVESKLRFDACPLLEEGAAVEVVGGPLRGVLGRLARKTGTHARIVLSVELIGRAVSVEVHAADVRAM